MSQRQHCLQIQLFTGTAYIGTGPETWIIDDTTEAGNLSFIKGTNEMVIKDDGVYFNNLKLGAVPIGGTHAGSPINLTSADANRYIRVYDQGSAPNYKFIIIIKQHNVNEATKYIFVVVSTLDVTIAVGSGLTLNSLDSKVKIAGQYGVVTLKKITSTE